MNSTERTNTIHKLLETARRQMVSRGLVQDERAAIVATAVVPADLMPLAELQRLRLIVDGGIARLTQ